MSPASSRRSALLVRPCGRLAGLLILAGGILTVPNTADAQQDHPGRLDLPEPVAAFAETFGPLFLPKVFADGWALQEFVRSEGFSAVRDSAGDAAAVDTLFRRALEISWGNINEALLISLAATVNHRRVGLSVPLLGPVIWIPLTGEFPEEFDRRVAALPSSLYPDTPEGPAGDRDKLQHFFGSAFLAALVESGESSDRVGEFVEWGEERFVVGGVNDDRDIRANRQGQQFGLRLVSDRRALPSFFLTGRAGPQVTAADSTMHEPVVP